MTLFCKKVNSKTKMRKNITAIIAATALLAASFLLDKPAANIIQAIKTPLLTAAVTAFDNLYIWIYIAFLAATIVAIAIKETKDKRTQNILKLLSTILTAMTITRLLKFIIQRQRPDGTVFELQFFGTKDYSFPSGHAAATAAAALAAPALLRVPWAIFTAVTVFDRLYLNVHFLSATVAGIIVAMLVNSIVKKMLRGKIRHEDLMEVRRQALHTIIGLALAVFVWEYTQLWYVILIIAAAGLGLSYAIKSVSSLRKLAVGLLELVERKEELKKFPGKGAIMLFIGAGITAAIFRKEAVAGIAILAVGDSISPLAGRLFGRTNHKWIFARKKTWEGTVAGFVFASAAAAFFMPIWTAIIAATAGMAVEAINVRILGRKVDDNLTVPVVAAAAIWVSKLLIM